MSDNILVTPLTDWHKAHGAKMAPFAGWDMPIQYEGILAEHAQTRSSAAVFDICHMGEFMVQGPGASTALSRAVSHNLSNLAPGKCRYGFLLNETGGILDDLIVYNFGSERFMLVVNAACAKKDLAVLTARLAGSVTPQDISANTGKIDLQGPKSLEVLQDVLKAEFKSLGYFSFREVPFDGDKIIVSRTGYTGELGYELYVPWDKTLALWEALIADARVKPVGLGARDTLRLESGLPLYGQDLDEQHTPTEAGMGHMLTSTAAYVGREHALSAACQSLVPLQIDGRRTARHGDIVASKDDRAVGVITSASYAPTLGYCVALAWVAAADAGADEFVVRASKTTLPAKRVPLPFYKDGTARMKLS